MIKKYLHIILLAIVHLLFFWYASNSLNIYLKDSFEYLQLAENITQNQTFYSGDLDKPFQKHLVSLRPPVYSLFIAAIKSVFSSNMAICFAQAIISLISIVLLFYLLKLYFSEVNKWFVVAILLCFASQFIYSNFIMSEILFQFFIILFVFLHAMYFKFKSKINLLLAQFIMCLMLFTKPVAIVIFIFYLGFIIYSVIIKEVQKPILYYLLIPVFMLMGYQYYNFKKTGYFHYSSITSTYLINYQLYKTLLIEYSEEDAQHIINSINETAEIESSFKGYTKKRNYLTMEELRGNITTFTVLTAKGVFNFFVDAGAWDIKEFFVSKHISNKLFVDVYILFCYLINTTVLCLFLYSFTQIKTDPFVVLLIIIVLALCFATGLNGTARFRLPVQLPLIFLCIYSVQSIHIKAFIDKFRTNTL